MPRPSSYDPEIGWVICERIANGETLTAICRDAGMPKPGNVLMTWCQDPSFSEAYAHAKKQRLQIWAEQLHDHANNPLIGQRVKKKEVSKVWRCPACQRECRWAGVAFVHTDDTSPLCDGVEKPEKEVTYEEEVSEGDNVDRSRLMVDTGKFILARQFRQEYGDRLELAGDKDAPLTITVRRKDRE